MYPSHENTLRTDHTPLRTDLVLLAVLFVSDLLLAYFFGFPFRLYPRPALTPAVAYVPIFLGLSVVGLRTYESLDKKILLLPLSVLGLNLLFCLLVDFPRDLWGVNVPNQVPLWVRVVWVWLLIVGWHPWMAARLTVLWNVASDWMRDHGLLARYYPLLALLLLFVAWLVRSQNISVDGYDWAASSQQVGRWWEQLREPLSVLFYRWGYQLLYVRLGWALTTMVGVISILAGVATLPLIVAALRRLVPEREVRIRLYLLLLGSGGFTLLFAGNVEVYALLVFGFWAFLAAAGFYAEGSCRIWIVGLVFGIAACFHLSFAVWVPALLAVPWLLAPRGKTDAAWRATGIVTLTALVFPVLFMCVILQMGYAWDPVKLWEHFWSKEVMSVGLDEAMLRPVSDAVSIGTYIEYLNHAYYLNSTLPAWLAFLVVGGVSHTSLGEGMRKRWWWFVLLLIPYFFLFLLWRPDRAGNGDWDLFSGMVSPLILVLGLRSVPAEGFDTQQEIAFNQVLWWGGLYVALQLFYCHAVRIQDWPIPK